MIKAGKTALEKEEKESGTTVTAPRKRVRGMKIPAIDSDITVGTPKPIKRQRKPLTKTPMLAASQPSTLSAMQPEPSFYPTPQSMSGQYTPGHHRGHSDATPYGTPQAQPGSYFAHPMAINQCSGHGTASSAVLSPPPFPTPRSDMVSQAANTSFDSLGGMANYPLVQVHGGQPSMQQQWQVSSGFPPSAHAMQSIPNDGMHAFNIQPPSHLHQFQPQVQNLHYSLPRFTSAASLQSLVGVQGSGEFVLGPPLQPPHASGIQTEASPNPGAAAHFHESSSANENSAALPDNK